MRKTEFIEYVRNPEKISCDTTVELQKLSKEFPWFQTAHVLLCRNLNACGNLGFEKQLRLTAAYSGDRLRLHQVVMDSLLINNKEAEKSDEKLEKIPETKKFHTSKSEKSNTSSTDKELSEKEQEAIVDEGKKTSTIEKQPISLTKAAEEKPIEKKHPDEELLERQVLSHAISNSNLLNEEIDDELDSTPIIKLSANVKTEEVPEISSEFDEAENHTFNDWLKHLQEDEDEAGEVSALVKKIQDINTSLPESPKAKTDFYDPSKMAKLSVKEDDDLVTETLAKIYASQGKLEKAINAYKKLSLKYPEKKFYFASQIKSLEETLYS